MRILVIEDEQDLASAIKKGLEMEGFAVDIVFDGGEGCQLAEIHTYDIIILDLNLPDMSGLDVLQHIRHLSKQIRVLILTAFSDTPSRVKVQYNGIYLHEDLINPPKSLLVVLSSMHILFDNLVF
jgi:DNA-binding response OmpR family regulator